MPYITLCLKFYLPFISNPKLNFQNGNIEIVKKNFLSFCPESSWVFATNSDFQIPIFLQLNVVDLRYFKL